MNLFIAISSCQRYEDNGWNDAQRETWLQDATDLGIPYKFFIGEKGKPKDDVVVVSSGDDYGALFYKTVEKYRWVYEHGYDVMFHCYHDTYACPERLLKWATVADYFGDYYHIDKRQPWPHESYGKSCQGGPGVIISRKALEILVRRMPIVIKQVPYVCEEDWWTGLILSGRTEFQGVKMRDAVCKEEKVTIQDSRLMRNNLTPSEPGPRTDNEIISSHLSTITIPDHIYGGGRESEAHYSPEFMYKLHKEWKVCPPFVPEPIVVVPLISSTPAMCDFSNGPKRISRRLSPRSTRMHS